MPIAASVSGTLTRVAAGGTAATGTLSVIGYALNPATGTLAIDRTLFLAFYSRVRLTRPDVWVGGYLMANLVDTVEFDESLDDPVQYATFTLSDKRVAYFDAATLSQGKKSVEIDLWAGPPGAVLLWEFAFVGDTETNTNTMPYRPRGQFRAVSRSAAWADRLGCLLVPPMSGLRRGEILAAFAESAGVDIPNAVGLGGAIVTKKIDIAGKTPFDLIKEFGEIEGWFARMVRIPQVGGTSLAGLEVISEDTILDGAPIFFFDESNTFDVPETTPDRPVTDWILSTTRIATGAAGTVTGLVTTVTASPGIDSNTIVESTTDFGVEIKRVETQWATVIAPGAYDSPTPAYQVTSRVTVENDWEPFWGPGGSMPSTQLNKRTTKTEQLGGVLADSGHGILWPGGGYYAGSGHAALIETEHMEELYSWGRIDDPCAIYRAEVTRWQNYSGISVTHTHTEYYADGSFRSDATYQWCEVMKDIVQYGSDGVGHSQLWRWYAIPSGEEQYLEVPIGASATSISAIAPITAVTPAPSTGSATIPQVSEEVIMAEFDATDASGYTKLTSSPGLLPYPENVYELLCIAWRRVIRATSDTLDIPHNAIPFLRSGDHVSVTNHARSLVDADAYVHAIKRTAEVTNGKLRQVTTAKIPKPELVAAFKAFRAASGRQ